MDLSIVYSFNQERLKVRGFQALIVILIAAAFICYAIKVKRDSGLIA